MTDFRGPGETSSNDAPLPLPDDAQSITLNVLRRHPASATSIALRGAQILPFWELAPEAFERVVAEIVAANRDSSVHFYGRRGQKQYGLDVYEEQAGGGRVLYQVKRYQTATPEDIRKAVQEWAGEPSPHAGLRPYRRFDDAGRFVVVTSAKLDEDVATTDLIAQLQREYRGDVGIDAWGAEALSHRARDLPAMVVSVFGDAWATELCGRDSTLDASRRLRKEQRAREGLLAAVSTQFVEDDSVKFRQADLVGISVDEIFVDVPVHGGSNSNLDALMTEIASEAGEQIDRNRGGHALLGAVQVLLHPLWTGNAVVVGGPGQGKSTLLQYISQFYRARLLGKSSYRASQLGLRAVTDVPRIPLKVELPKYAEWRRAKLQDRERRVATTNGTRKGRSIPYPTVEGFLLEIIRKSTGKKQFDFEDLRFVLGNESIMLVLDGLDEIADADERENVAHEIRTTCSRLSALNDDVIVVVATRPGSVGNPIWRDRDFGTLFLQRLTPRLRMAYVERWLATNRNLGDDERGEIRESFEQSIKKPHVAELAGNPMQLAILLHLVHKVPSLPEKRTKLYERYIDIFMQRESKSALVRDNREIIIEFHRVLAWWIHANVELKRSTGSISFDDLKQVLNAYFTPRQVDPGIVEEIFKSLTQRVLCLSETEVGSNNYAFDVQPLREYFASAYLYEMAPDDGMENIPQAILRTLLPRQFWSNVLRFFAGELRSGEISNIGYALDAVIAEDWIGFHPAARAVTKLLLDDQVFVGQHEVVTRDIVTKMIAGPGLTLAVDGLLQQGDRVLELPPGLATNIAIEHLLAQFLGADTTTAVTAAQLLEAMHLAGAVRVEDLKVAGIGPADQLQRLAAAGLLQDPDAALTGYVAQLVQGLDVDDRIFQFLLSRDAHVGGRALLAHCAQELARGRTPCTPVDRFDISSPLGQLAWGATSEALHRTARGQAVEPLGRNYRKLVRRRRTRGGGADVQNILKSTVPPKGDYASATPWRDHLDKVEEVWGAGSWPVREALLLVPESLLVQLAPPTGSLRIEAPWREILGWRRGAAENRDDREWWREQAARLEDELARSTFLVYVLTCGRSSIVLELRDSLSALVGEGSVSMPAMADTLARYRRRQLGGELRVGESLRLGQFVPSSDLAILIWQLANDQGRELLAKHIARSEDMSVLWGSGIAVVRAGVSALTPGALKANWHPLKGGRSGIPFGLLPWDRFRAMHRHEARDVLERPSEWPTEVVRAAVDRLTVALADLPSVSRVACQGGWAGPDGDLVGNHPPTERRATRKPFGH